MASKKKRKKIKEQIERNKAILGGYTFEGDKKKAWMTTNYSMYDFKVSVSFTNFDDPKTFNDVYDDPWLSVAKDGVDCFETLCERRMSKGTWFNIDNVERELKENIKKVLDEYGVTVMGYTEIRSHCEGLFYFEDEIEKVKIEAEEKGIKLIN